MGEADTLVLITPANPNAADQAGLVLEPAKAAGVRKIVRVSVFKAAVDGPTAVTRLHGRADAEIQAAGLRYVILRPPFFMQNLFFTAVTSIASMGGLFFGTGDGKIGMLDLRDIVDCAEQSVVNDTYDNQIFTLTGPEAISFHDIANRLTTILERPIQYIPVSPESVEQSIRALGMGAWYARVMRDLCVAYSEHWGDITTDERGASQRPHASLVRRLCPRAVGPSAHVRWLSGKKPATAMVLAGRRAAAVDPIHTTHPFSAEISRLLLCIPTRRRFLRFSSAELQPECLTRSDPRGNPYAAPAEHVDSPCDRTRSLGTVKIATSGVLAHRY